MKQPDYLYEDGLVSVRTYGNVLQYDPNDTDLDEPFLVIKSLAFDADAQDVLWQRLANDQFRDSRFRVQTRNTLPRNGGFGTINHKRLDGVILTRHRDAVAFATRDRPILVLYSERGGMVAVLHCGRSSLHGVDLGDPKESVIANALKLCRSEWKDLGLVRGVITAGIAPEHFPNDHYPHITEALRATWGDDVVPDTERHTIDLAELILVQLQEAGIRIENIEHDGVDTFSDEGFASVRAMRGGHNLVLVTRR